MIRTIRGVLASLLFTLNLFFIPVLVIVIGLFLHVLPWARWQRFINKVVQALTVAWVAVNNAIVSFANFRKFEIKGSHNLSRNHWYLLISNHSTWADILVLNKVFNHPIPLLKFFLKKQLLWSLPIAGLACKVVGYPFMERATREQIRKNPGLKHRDLEITKQACARFQWHPSTPMIFVEGTRFTAAKHAKQDSPFQHLLKPQAASIAIVLDNMRGFIQEVVDVTINYEKSSRTLWDFMCGNVGKIYVDYQVLPVTTDLIGDFENDREYRKHIQGWLNQIWQRKDQLLSSYNQLCLKLATRQSPLALIQADLIQQRLHQARPNLSIELMEITTRGDQILDKPLTEVGGKSSFTKELQRALLDKKADIAVHSLKDMSVQETPSLKLAAICKREDARDCFVSNHFENLEQLPSGATIGTASPRRISQLKRYRPDLQIKLCRGNVNTRLKKLDAGEYDALILAAAGLNRLQLSARIKTYLDPFNFVPAIAQGALAVECVADNTALIELLSALNDSTTAICVQAERAVNQKLMGDCYTAIGAYAFIENSQLHLIAMVGSEDGTQNIMRHKIGSMQEPMQLGFAMAEDLIAAGALEIIQK